MFAVSCDSVPELRTEQFMLKSATAMVMQVLWYQDATAAQGRPICGEPTPTPSLAKVMLCFYVHPACLCIHLQVQACSCASGSYVHWLSLGRIALAD